MRRARRGWGRPSLVLYDVTTLYFETDAGDGFREPGFSKERRLEPQITLGLLTDAAGFPLTVEAFEGNKAETATMLPVINAFKTAHQLTDVTVVADAGMISEANQSRPAGRRVVVHPRRPDPVPARCGARMARQTPRRGDPRRAGVDPAVAGHQPREGPRHPGPGHPLPVPPRPGPAHAARHRRAGRQGPECRRRARPGQTQPVHPADRRDQERQPRPGGQDPRAGRAGRATPPT